MFQLTPARSGRPQRGKHGRAVAGFNSRPRAAGDTRVRLPAVGTSVSTHARAQRATFSECARNLAIAFQLTPARSGRRASARWSYVTVFQLTPARSGRLRETMGA